MKKIIMILVFGLTWINLMAATIYIAKTNGEVIEVVTDNIKSVHFSDEKVAMVQLIGTPKHVDWLSDIDAEPQQVELRVVLRDGNNQPLAGKEVVITANLGVPLEGNYLAVSDENGEINLQWEVYPHECPPPSQYGFGSTVMVVVAQVLGESILAESSILLFRY
jgi:hypothetical protein